MRNIIFEKKAFDEFCAWAISNKKVYAKIADLIKEIERTPFTGKGKPEALKHQLKGYWSRRITDEHRLVYSMTEESVIILSCQGHYM